jgi:HD-GYP domain-containing protein (c-di-GMP phosphodiesterase class II)
MVLELIVREGRQPGRVFSIPPGDRKTIGRAPDCDIRLPDEGVSRRHCTIENLGERIQVIDLESANGSYINGELVERGWLSPGDQLALGPTVLECRSKPAPQRAAAPLAFSEEHTTTVVRKVVDTQYPGMLPLAVTRPEDLEELQRAQRNLGTAYQVSKMLAGAVDLEGLYDGVIESIFAAINADRAALILEREHEGSGKLEVVAARSRRPGRDSAATDEELEGELGDEDIADESTVSVAQEIGQTVSRTVVQDVLEKNISSLSHDATADAQYREAQSIIQQKIRSVMCAPIATDERVLGVLYADSRSLTGAFSENDLDLLALIGNLAGVTIRRTRSEAERARLQKALEEFNRDAIKAIVAIIDARDGYTHRHSERVAGFGARIATELGRSAVEIEVVQLSGQLHDIGKMGVPEAILNQPRKLTPEEFAEIMKHPVHGVNILSHIRNPRFEAILPGVRHHHEKWDGSGYPDGLAGTDIPFLGRLLAVADVLDALSSDRPYRKGMGFDKTVEIIQEDAGTHFDPEIAEAAAALHSRGELEVPAEWIEPPRGPDPSATLEP